MLKWDDFELAPKKRKKRESIFDTLPLHFGDLWGGSSRDLSKINIRPSNKPLTRLSTNISPTGQIPTVRKEFIMLENTTKKLSRIYGTLK